MDHAVLSSFFFIIYLILIIIRLCLLTITSWVLEYPYNLFINKLLFFFVYSIHKGWLTLLCKLYFRGWVKIRNHVFDSSWVAFRESLSYLILIIFNVNQNNRNQWERTHHGWLTRRYLVLGLKAQKLKSSSQNKDMKVNCEVPVGCTSTVYVDYSVEVRPFGLCQ